MTFTQKLLAWAYGAMAAAFGGVLTTTAALFAGQTIGAMNFTLRQIGAVAIGGALTAVAAYFRESPLPKIFASCLIVGIVLTSCSTSTGGASIQAALAKLPATASIVTADNANEALVKTQVVRVLARDTVATAAVAAPGAHTDGIVATFDKYDRMYTDTYRKARAAVQAGRIDEFRSYYSTIIAVVQHLAGAAGGVQ